MPSDHKNLLAYGDNLDVLRRHVRSESVDLIYLDPPFKPNVAYNVLFEEHGIKAAGQIRAFEDTWSWDTVASTTYREVVERNDKVSVALRAFRSMLGDTDMLAYLSMMAPRLVELHRVLKPDGSLYLHCDPAASHYLKLLLDAVFGPERYTNEITWRRYGAHNDTAQGSRHFGRVHDTLLLYAKGDKSRWTQVFTPLGKEYVANSYRHVEEGSGRRFATMPLTGPGGAAKGNPVYEWRGHVRAWRYSKETMERLDAEGRLYYSRTGYVRQKKYLDESRGVPVQDVWADIPSLSGAHRERLGYPTQKPEALIERILLASSREGDVVLDPFCGCGTAVSVAQRLGRRWIGIDITHFAIGLIKSRLIETYGLEISSTYRVIGEPTTVQDAAVLADEDPFQFQAWALGLVGARPLGETKRGGDKGIDGRLFYHDQIGGPSRQIIISVKAGHLVPAYVRDLARVIAREEAEIGVLVSFRKATPGMRAEAADAGVLRTASGQYPRIQLLTVAELLGGQRIAYPPAAAAPATIWPPESIPTVPKPKRRRHPRAAAARASWTTADVEPPPVGEASARLREDYARRADEARPDERRVAEEAEEIPADSEP